MPFGDTNKSTVDEKTTNRRLDETIISKTNMGNYSN
jgi:hypothetical protein